MSKVSYWSLFTVYVIGTLLLTTVVRFDFVPNNTPLRGYMGDMAHFILMGGFALFALLGLNRQRGKVINWAKNSYWGAFLCAFSFGAFIEFLQSVIPTRAPSWNDIVMNSLGIVFVLGATHLYSRTENYRSQLVDS